MQPTYLPALVIPRQQGTRKQRIFTKGRVVGIKSHSRKYGQLLIGIFFPAQLFQVAGRHLAITTLQKL